MRAQQQDIELNRNETRTLQEELEPSTVITTIPDKSDVDKLKRVTTQMNPLTNAIDGITGVLRDPIADGFESIGISTTLKAEPRNNLVEQYLKNPKKFIEEETTVRIELKKDFKRGLLNELSFGRLESNEEFVEMNGSPMEMAGAMTGLLARDATISAVTKAPMSVVMGVSHGITKYNQEIASGENEDRALEYAVSSGLAMTAGFTVGLKIVPATVGYFLKEAFGTGVIGSFLTGGSEMMGWVGAEHYADRVLKNLTDIAHDAPEMFSTLGALEKSQEFVEARDTINSMEDSVEKQRLASEYQNKLTTDSLELARRITEQRKDEEPISADTAMKLFVVGGILPAVPVLMSKTLTKTYSGAKRLVKIPADKLGDRLPSALSRIPDIPIIKSTYNKKNALHLDSNMRNDVIDSIQVNMEVKGGRLESAIVEEWFNLPPAYQNEVNYRRLMRMLGVRK